MNHANEIESANDKFENKRTSVDMRELELYFNDVNRCVCVKRSNLKKILKILVFKICTQF